MGQRRLKLYCRSISDSGGTDMIPKGTMIFISGALLLSTVSEHLPITSMNVNAKVSDRMLQYLPCHCPRSVTTYVCNIQRSGQIRRTLQPYRIVGESLLGVSVALTPFLLYHRRDVASRSTSWRSSKQLDAEI